VSTRSFLTYVGIGVAAGVFSALFGVGGGGIVVPLLILLAHFGSKPATGTSLAAIGLTALAGAISFTTLGEVEWGYAALVGIPALAGTAVGTWAQQRMSSRLLTVLFAAFLVAVAITLFLE
jgi:uncharacterized membrane protein YfcA